MKLIHLAFAIALLLNLPAAADENWPSWRGPKSNGTCDAKGLPVKWSEKENIVWKSALPWWSGSSPVIWGDRIFLTSPEKSTPENTAEVPKDGDKDPGGPTILLLCLNRKDGAVLWTHDLGKGNELKRKQNMSSPSPVTDGQNVWIMTGKGNLFCLDFTGKEIWKRNLQDDYGKFGTMWGYASSSVLFKDKLIVPVLQGFHTDEPSYLLAVDKLTGKTIWKTNRVSDAQQESPDSYATPQIFEYDGKTELVMNGSDIVTGHDPVSGEELWRVTGTNPSNSPWYRTIASVVCVDGMIFSPSRRSPLTCIKAGGRGDITETHVLWQFKLGPDVPTGVANGTHLWNIDDDGRFTCLDVKTGEALYKPERLAQGTYDASLVMADGKIYATNEGGTTTVLAAVPEFKVLSVNKLDDEYTLSTPAIAGGNIFIRTSTHLYCIGAKEGKTE